MSSIDDLIAEHCPDGVPFKSLGEVATYVRGVTFSKSDQSANGPIPVLRANNVTLSSNALNFDDVIRIAGSVRVRADQHLYANDILISAASGSRAHVGKVAFVADDLGDYVFGGFMGVLRTVEGEVHPRFLFHVLTGASFAEYLDQGLSTSTINNLNSRIVQGFRFPVPPAAVQSKIVSILDTFRQLGDALASELASRRAQRLALANNVAVGERGLEADSKSDRVPLGLVARESIDPVEVQTDRSYSSLGVKWNGEGVLAREPRSGDAIKAKTLFRARPGQLIYNRMFVVEGSFAIVPEECDQAVVSGEFPMFDIDTARVEPLWLLHHLCGLFTIRGVVAA